MGAPTDPAPKVAYWGHDLRDSTARKRVAMLAAAGLDPLALFFDRGAGPAPMLATGDPVDLGRTADARHVQRLSALPRAIWRARRALSQAEPRRVHIARNLDMLILCLLATAARGGPRPRIVYECLDIHRALSARGWRGRLLRWIERRALARVDALAVSSEAFVDAHFAARQGWTGPVTLLENRLHAPGAPRPMLDGTPALAADRPLTVVWAGMLRCAVTLELFKAVAAVLGDRVRFRLRGRIQAHAIPDFEARIAGHPAISYEGPYAIPDELSAVYAGADLVWAQDLWRRGGNSDWLLPNRLYEAGYFGVPALAVAPSETARIVAARGWGYALPDAEPATLAAFLTEIDRAALQAARARLLSTSTTAFATDAAEASALMRALVAAAELGAEGAGPAPDAESPAIIRA